MSLRAPITSEAERTLFQRRLGLASLVIFILSFGFFVVANASLAIFAPERLWEPLKQWTGQVHMMTIAGSLVMWLVVRRGTQSRALLDALDALGVLGLCAGWIMMIAHLPADARPESIALLACTYTLVTRAALIPSTPLRTAALGALGFAPLVPVTSNIYAVEVPAVMPLPPTIYVIIWSALGITATTVISWVIYGLQLQVRKAMQLGQYLLEDKIGEGGMGVVYRASHAMLRRPTAIKLLTGSTGQAAERFEREVQITARLTHPNTVAVFDYGRTPDGVFYYAMELLDGVSLEDLVEAHGAQPIARTVHILVQMCGALEEAHAAGLVHRDIKPANVMLTERGGVPDVVKVLDFGLVKETQQVGPAMSAVNTLLGTPHYMAPEAIVDPAKVDARTDLYAIGATAYFLLTGKRVFDGKSIVEVCSQHLHQGAPAPSASNDEISEALDAVVLACLAKKPEDRPASAEALADMLRAVGAREWTREDARAWWADRGGPKAARPKANRDSDPALGKTVAVALDDRGAA
ncbi:MAG: serine/threonine protein kinase [Labilithrix sp.]|nr:serine/threonine protein kinase [Labilithrix sp.]